MSTTLRIVANVAIVAALIAVVAYVWYHHGPAPGPPGPISARTMNFDGSGAYAVVGASDKFAITPTQPMRVTFDVASRRPSGGFVMGMVSTITEYFVVWLDVAGGINFRAVTRSSDSPTVTISSGSVINVLDGDWHSIAFAVTIPIFTHQRLTLTVDKTVIAPVATAGLWVHPDVVNIGNRPTGVLTDFGQPLNGCIRDLRFNAALVTAASVGKVGTTCKLA
jgi:Laminin G domain